MRIPAKYLFYDGLPNAKDVDKLMAANGYSTLPKVDNSNYRFGDVQTSIDPAPPDNGTYLDTSVAPGMDASFHGDRSNTYNINNNPNNFGDYFNTGLGIADSLIPGERIHNNYVTQPLPVYNPHPYGTGSQAIMDYGGALQGFTYGLQNLLPKKNMNKDVDDDSDEAKSGWLSHAVNPAHKGYCTPMTKSTCTPRRKAFAERAKHHNLEDGGKIPPQGQRYVSFPYGQPGNMAETETIDMKNVKKINSPNKRGFVNAYNAIDAFGNKTILNDEQIPSQYLSPNNHNNFALGSDSVYVAPGVMNSNVHIPYYNGGELLDDAASGIHIKPSHKGRFTAYKKRTGKTTEEALHSSDPHVRQMANFARNAKKWHHGENGLELPVYDPNIQYESGGSLSSDKAKEILRDGTAQGHKLTSKQKRYFGFVAGGGKPKAPDGIQIPKAPPGMQQVGSLAPTPQSRTDAYLLDDINQTLATGQRTKNTGYNPQQQQLLNDAYIWRSSNSFNRSKDVNQNIQGYFGRPVDQNNPLDIMRARLSKIGGDPVSMYNTTPNLDVKQPQAVPPQATVASTMESGGYVEGSTHDLSEEEIAKLLKSGHKIEYLD